MKTKRHIASGLIVATCFAGLLLIAGCSKAPKPGNSVVRGSVTYKGQKLMAGMLEFWNQDGPVGHAPINQDGIYEAIGLADGNYQICVVTVPLASLKSLEMAGFSTDGKRPNAPPAMRPGMAGFPGGLPGGPSIKRGAPGGQGNRPDASKPQRGREASSLPPGAPRPPFPIEGGLASGSPNPLDFLPKEKRQLHQEVQKKFGTVMVSKITITVQPGEQTFDLKLE
jgi:hypothetical protein